MDVHSQDRRSYNMSRIRDKNTKPEIIIRRLLWGNGYRYRLYPKQLPGKPDIVFPGKKKAIFIHGCFWHNHGCRYFKWPTTNTEFWKRKIQDNVARDIKTYELLIDKGWVYLVIWECETKQLSQNELLSKIRNFLST